MQARVRRAPVVTKALFGGGQGGGLDMSKLMENVKKAQALVQTETAKVQQELANTDFDGYDEDETVRVVMSGNQEPKSVDITQAAMDAGSEELSRRLTIAMKDAHSKSVAGMKEKMKELASSLGLPNAGQLGL